MASLVSGLFGHLKPSSRRGLFGGPKSKAAQVELRGASKRAYTFEVYRREELASLWETGAVYLYARSVDPESPQAAARDSQGMGLEVGYVGRTDNLGKQDAEHDRLGHFIGFSFDVALVLRAEQEQIRADIEADLIEHYRPVLNELLCGYRGGEAS